MSYTNCTTTTIQPVECTHPFDYLFKIMDDIYNSDGNTLSKFNILSKLLKEGLVVPNCNMCCPNCGDTYMLIGVECFLKWEEISEFQISDVGECCLNLHASTERYLLYREALNDIQGKIPATSCCGIEFNDCIKNFEEWFANKYSEDYSYFPNASPTTVIRDVLLDLGIVELSTIGSNQTSSICKLIELFDEYDLTDGLNAEQFIQKFISLFFACVFNGGDGGIIVKCYPNGSVYIGQIESLFKYEDLFSV
jgi:hypothetical protein